MFVGSVLGWVAQAAEPLAVPHVAVHRRTVTPLDDGAAAGQPGETRPAGQGLYGLLGERLLENVQLPATTAGTHQDREQRKAVDRHRDRIP
ncbi:hypothetical protein GCM10010254_11810 [Streptomyces chromofuscus]|nr:hypothetical protein GCM10010254_11810 [Streptomyces chromofuscus]